jgi:hypothetical protein
LDSQTQGESFFEVSRKSPDNQLEKITNLRSISEPPVGKTRSQWQNGRILDENNFQNRAKPSRIRKQILQF